jgi:hypothetical protein
MVFPAAVAFRAEMVFTLKSAVCIGQVEMHLFVCTSSMPADPLQCHFGKKGICPCDYVTAWPGVFLSQRAPTYVQEGKHPASFLLRLRRELS